MNDHLLRKAFFVTALPSILLCANAAGEDQSFVEQLIPEFGDFKLKYLDPDNDADPTGGIQFEKSATGDISALEDSFFNQYTLDIDATVAIDAESNPNPIKTKFSWYSSYDTFNTTGSVDDDGDPIIGADYGYFSYGLNATYETDQKFDNQNVSAGVFVSYLNDNTNDGWFLVPSVYVAFEGVKNLKSELRKEIGVDNNDEYTRFSWELHWEWHLSETFGEGFSPWVLNLNYRNFYEQDQEAAWQAADYDNYDYWKADLAYVFEKEKFGFSEVFIAISEGRLPTGQADQTTLSIGFILNPEKLGF